MASGFNLQLGGWDLAVVGAYVATMVAIGSWCRLKERTREGYFLGGRRFGAWIQSFAYFGQAASADGPVGVATTSYHNGASGIWSSFLMVLCTPLFWIVVPWLRRMRVLTMGDFYVERYGSRWMGAAYALIAGFGMMSLLAVGYIALAKTAAAIMAPSGVATPPGMIEWIMWAIFVLMVANSVVGGLTAAFHSALVQSILVVVLSVILIPFGATRLGAMEGPHGTLAAFQSLHHRLPESFFGVFGSEALPDFTWYYILAISLVAGLTVMTMPNQVVANASARTESSARIGMLVGTTAKRLCTIFWVLCGLFAVAIFGGSAPEPDSVWGLATRSLLAPAGCGLVGLMLAGLASGTMASSNLLMLSISGLAVNNLYRPIFPGKSEAHYVSAGRVAGVAFLAGGVPVALQFGSLFQALKFSWEFFTVFGAAFWLGLKWRRANRTGAWISILFSAAFFYVIPALLPMANPSLRIQPDLALSPAATRDAGLSPPGRGPVQAHPLATGPAVFWSQGLAYGPGGHPEGRGYLFLDLALLQKAGGRFDRHPAALIETIRIGIRLLVPFLLLALASLATKPDDPALLGRFFAKMRTPVVPSAAESQGRRGSTVRPSEQESAILVFPGSAWEFYRWTKQERCGGFLSVGLTGGLLGLLWLALAFGR